MDIIQIITGNTHRGDKNLNTGSMRRSFAKKHHRKRVKTPTFKIKNGSYQEGL